jgi:pilus assembly protein CpaF
VVLAASSLRPGGDGVDTLQPGPGLVTFQTIRADVRSRLVTEMQGDDAAPAIQAKIKELADDELTRHGLEVSDDERAEVVRRLIADISGFGPLQELLNDDDLTEIMVNGPKDIWVERAGRLLETGVTFDDDDHLMRVVDSIVSRIGRRVDEASPMCDARLPDGSRVNVIIPPLSLSGPVVTIRKFARIPFTMDDLIRIGTLSQDMAAFLRAAVRARLNILVSGGTGSGKTTFLNVLSAYIPEEQRIVTIEDSAELQLHQQNLVSLESKPPNMEGRGRIAIRDLVVNALRMRPDRIVVGEARGGEALDMLQAMVTGHGGSMTTVHANSPREAMMRLETLALMAGTEIPSIAIRENMAEAIQVIVQQARLRDGTRKIVAITEVDGLDEASGEFNFNDIFVWRQRGLDAEGRVLGELRPTGRPSVCADLIANQGEAVDPAWFDADPEARGEPG